MDWTEFVQNMGDAGTQGNTPGGTTFALNLASGFAQGFAAGGPIGGALVAVENSLQSGLALIGGGRREADIIVPIQNQYGNLLTEINRQMNDPALSVAQLQNMQRVVASGYARFDAFTRDARFTDGRASHQARDTIRPLVDGKNDSGAEVRSDGGTLGNLQRLIDAKGGGIIPEMQGIVKSSTPAGTPANNTLLLAGAGLAAAKIFGLF